MNASRRLVIQLGDVSHPVPAGTSLAALLDALGHAPTAVGTAVNGCFVARSQRGERVLAAGDQVVLFQPIVGG